MDQLIEIYIYWRAGAAKLQQNVSTMVKNLSPAHLFENLHADIPFPDPSLVNSYENLDLSTITLEIAYWLHRPWNKRENNYNIAITH